MIECISFSLKKKVDGIFFLNAFYLIYIICKYSCLLAYSLSFIIPLEKSVFLLTFLICLFNDFNLSRYFYFLRSCIKYNINLGIDLPVCRILMKLHGKLSGDCVLNILPNLFERRGIWEGLNG